MAKINPINGKMSGKVGGLVYAVNHGVSTVREKNPFPYNPKTEKQIEARAKLKLLSQIAAVMAPVLGFRRIGAVSPRNLFTRANYPAVADATVSGNDITVVTGLEGLDLTGGVLMLPDMASVTVSQGVASIALGDAAAEDIDTMVYAMVSVKESGAAALIEAKTVETAGEGRTFPTTINVPASVLGKVVVYAYGSKMLTERARTTYEHYKCNNTALEAMLTVVRTLSENDIALTQTKSAVFTQA